MSATLPNRSKLPQRTSLRPLQWLRAHPVAAALAAGLAVGGFLYVVPLLPAARSSTIRLVGAGQPGVDMLVKVNGEPIGRVSFPSRPLARTVPFEGQPIKTLQLLPEGRPGTRFTLSELEIAYGSSVLSKRKGEELSVLATTGVAQLGFTTDGLKGKLTGEPARIEDTPQPPLVVSNKIGELQQWLLGASRSPVMPNIWVVALLLGFGVCLSGTARRALPAAGAGVGVWVLAFVSYKAIPEIRNPNPAVDVAVGGASYFGTPYRGQQIAAGFTVLLILGAAAALRLHLDRRKRQTPTTAVRSSPPAEAPGAAKSDPRPSAPRNGVRGSLIVFGAWLGVSLTLFPALGSPSPDPVPAYWDIGNLTAWSSFIQDGLVPMRDYWFPYGYQWLFSHVPLGPLWAWIANVAMLALLGWSLWRLSGRRAWRVAACLIAVGLLSSLGTGLWRYLPALLVATTYAAIGPARGRRLLWEHLLFFAACALALFIEADLLLMGLAGVLLVLFGEFLFGRAKLEIGVARNLVVDAVPVTGAVLLLVVVWIASGTLEGNLDFFLRLNDVAAYVGSDQKVDGMLSRLSLEPTANTLIAMVPFLLLVAGLVQGFLGNQPGSVAASRLLLAASGPSLILLARSLVRPNDLVYYLPLVAFACAAILLWDRRATAAAAFTGAFLGAVLAGLQFNGGLRTYLSGIGGTPFRAIDTLTYLNRPEEIRYAQDEAVAFRRFQTWPEAQLARRLLSLSGSRHPSFAALGDAPILYVWFRQAPPYHVNLYDSAPIHQQEEMIEQLERRKPTYLAWDRDAFAVDGVPYLVRDPLVFAYAVRHYAPVRVGRGDCPRTLLSCGAADILERRGPDQKVPFDYWRSRLGRQIDLNFIPVYADPPGEPCAGEKSCATYAVVRGTATYKGQPIEVTAAGRGREYSILMRALRGTSSYTVRLDRLWFWRFLGPRARLRVKTPGWGVEKYEGKSDDRLY